MLCIPNYFNYITSSIHFGSNETIEIPYNLDIYHILQDYGLVMNSLKSLNIYFTVVEIQECNNLEKISPSQKTIFLCGVMYRSCFYFLKKVLFW